MSRRRRRKHPGPPRYCTPGRSQAGQGFNRQKGCHVLRGYRGCHMLRGYTGRHVLRAYTGRQVLGGISPGSGQDLAWNLHGSGMDLDGIGSGSGRHLARIWPGSSPQVLGVGPNIWSETSRLSQVSDCMYEGGEGHALCVCWGGGGTCCIICVLPHPWLMQSLTCASSQPQMVLSIPTFSRLRQS